MTNEKDPYNLVIDKNIMDAYLNGLQKQPFKCKYIRREML